MLEIVTGVHDDGQLLRGQQLRQAISQLGSANAAGKANDFISWGEVEVVGCHPLCVQSLLMVKKGIITELARPGLLSENGGKDQSRRQLSAASWRSNDYLRF
jgi:hypothetical protein